MARIQIDDPMAGTSVMIDFTFNLNPLGSNPWQVVDGDSSVVGISEGHWNSEGVANQLIIKNLSDVQLGFLNMNLSVSLTDPFENVEVGTTGDGAGPNGAIGWTLLSK